MAGPASLPDEEMDQEIGVGDRDDLPEPPREARNPLMSSAAAEVCPEIRQRMSRERPGKEAIRLLRSVTLRTPNAAPLLPARALGRHRPARDDRAGAVLCIPAC